MLLIRCIPKKKWLRFEVKDDKRYIRDINYETKYSNTFIYIYSNMKC